MRVSSECLYMNNNCDRNDPNEDFETFTTAQQSPDVWMMLALAATRTERIGLGPGVLVPSLRHPMVNASGAAALSALAPGRVAVAFGTGFSGARAMGANLMDPRPRRAVIAAGLAQGRRLAAEAQAA